MEFKINFWGVRGSRPVPGNRTSEYGGNTSCLQMEVAGINLIFDGGTGIVGLGDRLLAQGKKEGHIFLSHTHWDHIQGLPFFKPFFHKNYSFKIYGEDGYGMTIEEIIKGQMREPYFPIYMEDLSGQISFKSLKSGDSVEFDTGQAEGKVRVRSFALDHPGGSLAYRIEYGKSSAVYATDTETLTEDDRKRFIDFISGANVFIYDTFFTEEEYEKIPLNKNGKKWGHSTWQEGAALAKAGQIGIYVLFHHKDDRTDEELDEILTLAREEFPNTMAACEGLVIELGGGPNE